MYLLTSKALFSYSHGATLSSLQGKFIHLAFSKNTSTLLSDYPGSSYKIKVYAPEAPRLPQCTVSQNWSTATHFTTRYPLVRKISSKSLARLVDLTRDIDNPFHPDNPVSSGSAFGCTPVPRRVQHDHIRLLRQSHPAP